MPNKCRIAGPSHHRNHPPQQVIARNRAVLFHIVPPPIRKDALSHSQPKNLPLHNGGFPRGTSRAPHHGVMPLYQKEHNMILFLHDHLQSFLCAVLFNHRKIHPAGHGGSLLVRHVPCGLAIRSVVSVFTGRPSTVKEPHRCLRGDLVKRQVLN